MHAPLDNLHLSSTQDFLDQRLNHCNQTWSHVHTRKHLDFQCLEFYLLSSSLPKSKMWIGERYIKKNALKLRRIDPSLCWWHFLSYRQPQVNRFGGIKMQVFVLYLLLVFKRRLGMKCWIKFGKYPTGSAWKHSWISVIIGTPKAVLTAWRT